MQHRYPSEIWRRRLGHVRTIGLVIGVLVGLSVPRYAQAQPAGERVLAEVEAAFGRGAEQVIMRRAAPRIEIALFGANMLYSEAQAQLVLRNFFRDFPPRRFAFQERSQSGSNWFAAGTYWHEEDDGPFRVYVRLQERAGAWELRSIRINRRDRR